jgi:hypothetical protein
VQPELNAELNAMSDDEFAAIIGAGTASGRPEAEADDEREAEVGPARSSREASEQSGPR